MSDTPIASRRKLVAAACDIAKKRTIDPEDVTAALDALSAILTDELGFLTKVVMVRVKPKKTGETGNDSVKV